MKIRIFQILFFFSALLLTSSGKAQEAMDAAAQFKVGEALSDQSKFKEAIPIFQQVLDKASANNDWLLQAKASKRLADCQVFTGDVDASIETYKLAVALAEKLDQPYLILGANSGISEIYFMRKQFAEALPYHITGNKAALAIEDWYSYANSLSMIGYDHLMMDQLDSARHYIEASYQFKIDRNLPEDLMLNYDHLASLYTRLNDRNEAMKYALLGIEVLEKQGESPALVIKYSKLAEVFILEKNLKRAEEYAQKSVALARKLDLNYYAAYAFSSLARVKEKQQKFGEALKLFEEALSLNQFRNNEGAMIERLLAMVHLCIKQNKLQQADKYFKEAQVMIQQRNQLFEVLDAHLISGQLSILNKDFSSAQTALEAAQVIVDTLDNLVKSQHFYQLQSDYFEQSGQYLAAIESGEKAALLNDSIFNLEKSERLHELEEQFERAKKEKEITLLQAEKDIKDLTIRENRRSVLTTLIGLLLACGVLISLYYLYRLRHKTNERLGEKNRLIAKALSEKEFLLKEIHHRVKNNLQVVSSLLKLQSKFIDDTKALDALQEGRNRVKSMAIIHQNLYQKDNLLGVSVKEYIEKLSESLFHSYNIDPDRIDLETQIDELNLDVDTVIPLGLILNELLTNALKYAFPNDTKGIVVVSLRKEEKHLLLEVKDNGVGIQSAGLSNKKDGGFGIKLIETFALKLKGKLQIHQENGTVVQLLIQNFKTT